MSKEEFVVEFNDNELGECRIYQKNITGYNQAIKDLKLHKAKQTKQITDLEAKLAEYDSELAENVRENECLKDEIYKLKQQLAEKEKIEYTDTINFVETSEPDIVAKELDRLNQQLAEKDKEIEELKLRRENTFNKYSKLVTEYDLLVKENDELEDKLAEKEKDQDKISFAVEQLEELKTAIYNLSYTELILKTDCYEEIDNQIKSIKEGK